MTRKQKLYESRAILACCMTKLTQLNKLDLSKQDYQTVVGNILSANKTLNETIDLLEKIIEGRLK